MTEIDLVLGSLTPEELDDARKYVRWLTLAWQTQIKDHARRIGLDTDGPWHLLRAMNLAVIREMAQRGGAAPWYMGEPTTDHIAQRELDLYARRYTLRAQEAAVSAAGRMERTCAVCGIAQPQDAEHFARHEGLWAETCRACHRIDPERYREAIAYSPPPAASPPPTDDALLRML